MNNTYECKPAELAGPEMFRLDIRFDMPRIVDGRACLGMSMCRRFPEGTWAEVMDAIRDMEARASCLQ